MEIQAAIGSAQIDEIDKFVEKRRHIASRVSAAIAGTNLSVIGSKSLQDNPKSNSWMLIPILIGGVNPINQKQNILAKLEELEVETRPVLTGNFLAQPAIQRITRHAVDPTHFTNATKITNEAFMVGAHHDLTNLQIDFLCEALVNVQENA